MLVSNNNFLLKEVPAMSPLSRDYRSWWGEQYNYCKNGYWSSGKYMPGNLYFYINFWNILLNKTDRSKNKTLARPLLRDIEWEMSKLWMEARGFSRFSGQDEIIMVEKNPREILNTLYDKPQGIPLFENDSRNLMVIAGRGCGKSYMTSGMFLGHEFIFHDNSEIVVGAGDSKYSSTLLDKVKLGLNNLAGGVKLADKFYPSPFYKRTSGNWGLGTNVEARYKKKIGGTWVTKGSGSKIKHITFRDNHSAANGTRPSVLAFEEIGIFDNLIESHNSSKECMMNGSVKFGSAVYIGTGGDMKKGTVDAQKMFYDPEAYDMLSFRDDWEYKGKICYFIPGYKGLNQFKDVEGETNVPAAKNYLLEHREKLRNSKDKRVLHQEMQYRPLVPSEAFLMDSANIFPVGLLKDRLAKLESNTAYKDSAYIGDLVWTEDAKIRWRLNPDLQQLDFPAVGGNNTDGCVTIWEHPVENPPYGLYVAGTDPYDHDKSNTGSLGSTIIYKRFSNIDASYEWPVAEYTGRPKTANEYYENVRKLLTYYNATCLYENERKGMFQYFEYKQCTNLLRDQPLLIKDILKKTEVERGKGMHMNKALKDYGEILVRDWLLDEFDSGKSNVNKIMSIPLLKELVAYNEDGNFDRVIAFMMVMYHRQELHKIHVQERREVQTDGFWNKPLFSRNIKITY